MIPSTKNVKFMTSESGVETLGWGQYCYIVKMYHILRHLFYSNIYIYEINELHVFMSLYCQYQHCEIHGPWARGIDLRWVGPILPYSENVLDSITSFLLPCIFEKN